MTVAITQTIAGVGSTQAYANESSVQLAFTGLTATTIYAVSVGMSGGLATVTAPTWNRLTSSGAQTWLVGTSDGSGNLTVTFYPNHPGAYTVKAYPITTPTDAASGIAGNTFTVYGGQG